MRRNVLTIVHLIATVLALVAVLSCSRQPAPEVAQPQPQQPQWVQHDRNAPQPPVVTPGDASTQAQPGKPPSDAVVLFDGKDLSGWESLNGGPANWKVGKGYFETVPKAATSAPSRPSAIANFTWNGPRPIRRMAKTRTAETAAFT